MDPKKINIELLIALKRKGWHQRRLAKEAGDHESITSRIINGIWLPDEKRKIRYANALGVQVSDIFRDRAYSRKINKPHKEVKRGPDGY